MGYIDEINSFYNWLEANPLPPSSIALWYALLSVCNKSGWKDEFNAANSVLEFKSGLSESSIKRCRNKLKQVGLIDFKTRGGNQSAIYRLIPFAAHGERQSERQASDKVNDKRATNERQSEPILRQDKDHKTLKEIKENLESAFKEFYACYPKKVAKPPAEKAYLKLKPDDELQAKILDAIDKNIRFNKQWQEGYIPNPATWLNQRRWEDDITPLKITNAIDDDAERREILKAYAERKRSNNSKPFAGFISAGSL